MKVKEITISGMHKVATKTYNLNDKVTYFTGVNGAGKSTILEAIQLALLGYIPGYAKTNESIMKHASAPTMTVSLKLDSDITITRTWMRSGTSIKSNIDVQGYEGEISELLAGIELPIFNFDEFKSMTANKLKEWFITFLPSQSEESDFAQRLVDATKSRSLSIDNLLEEANNKLSELSGLSEIEKVKALNAYFKEEQSFVKGKIAKLQGTIESLVYYDDAPDLNEEEIKTKLNELSKLKDELIRYETAARMQTSAQETIAELKDCLPSDSFSTDDRIPKMEADIAAINEHITAAQSEYQTLNEEKTKLVSELSKLSTTSRSVCPYTQQQCSTIEAWFSENQKKADELNKQLSEINTKLSKVDMVSCRTKEAEKQQIIANIEFIRGQYSKLDALESQIVKLEDRPTDKSVDELSAEMNDLHNGLAKILANAQYEALQEQVTADKFALECDLEILKIWAKLTDANGLQTELMNKPFENLAEEMSTYLTTMFGAITRAKFNLISKANSFSFGLERNDSYIEFDCLSSGEKCLFTLALLMCILNKSESQIRTILIDDILDHLDSINADHLFDALSKVADIQFVLAGVKECKDNSICVAV